MKKRLNRLRLEQLEEHLLPLKSGILSSLIGGGNGSYENPYTVSEMDSLMNSGEWDGGYVEGMAYDGGIIYVGGDSTAFGYSDPGSGAGYYTTPYEYGKDTDGFWANLTSTVLSFIPVLNELYGAYTDYWDDVHDYLHNELYGMNVPAHNQIYVEKISVPGINNLGTINIYDSYNGNLLLSFDSAIFGGSSTY